MDDDGERKRPLLEVRECPYVATNSIEWHASCLCTIIARGSKIEKQSGKMSGIIVTGTPYPLTSSQKRRDELSHLRRVVFGKRTPWSMFRPSPILSVSVEHQASRSAGLDCTPIWSGTDLLMASLYSSPSTSFNYPAISCFSLAPKKLSAAHYSHWRNKLSVTENYCVLVLA
jgi:hypothetical protein